MSTRWQLAGRREASESHDVNRWSLQITKGHYHSFQPEDTWTPPINVYEDDLNFYVVANLAGVGSGAIDLEFAEGRLVLCGHRATPPPPEVHGKLNLLHMEIDHGTFRRIVEIPGSVQEENIRAIYRTGQLLITLPKQI